MNLRGKKIAVLGLGEAGYWASEFLLKKEANVFVSEKNENEELTKKAGKISTKGADYELGGHTLDKLLNADLIVKSPGIPGNIEVLEKLKDAGKEIIGELELGTAFLSGKIIAITGSNGKSTTTALTHKIIAGTDKEAVKCGNIGYPVTRAALERANADFFVIEVSSFQLENIKKFKPDIAVLLNITPDHLNRHENMERYRESKGKIFKNQTEKDFSLLNSDDPLVNSFRKDLSTRYMFFGKDNSFGSGAYLKDGKIYISDKNKNTELLEVEQLKLLGPHNVYNVMASALGGYIADVDLKDIRESVRSFEGLEHRLEYVTELAGITFYNDSKATNIESALMSLKAFPKEKNITLILGGKDKGGDFSRLKEPVEQRVERLILIGENREKLAETFGDSVETMICESMEEAVVRGSRGIKNKGIFLLAPACASYDMYENFEERGNVFKEVVTALKKGINA